MRLTARLVLALTLFQVGFGAFTRGSGSGFGCRDRWPLCDGGAVGGLLPRLEPTMIVEWSHRWIASLVGIGVVVLVIRAWRTERDRLGLALAALATVLVQALLGAAVVWDYGNADLVTAHLAGALLLLAVLTALSLERPARVLATASQRWWRLVTVVAIGSTLLFGSAVHDQYVGGWPLVGDDLVPPFGISPVVDLHIIHRLFAAVAVVTALAAARVARRQADPVVRRLTAATLALTVGNVALGGVHVFTQVSSTAVVVAHLTVGATAWVTALAAWLLPDGTQR
jgi:heme A synthase